AVPCDLVKVAVMLPAATAVTVTTSKFCPASTSRSMLGNMLVVELTLNVCGNGPATIGPVMVTGNTAAGSEIRPAWPISCCSNSVALRTEVCISVRLATVPCVFIIWIKPDITMEDTSTKTASDVIVSMSVKPACPFLFMSLRILIVCTLLKRISLQRRQSGLRERGVPKRAANGDGDGDPFHGVRGVYVYRSNLPTAHILPTCRRTASSCGEQVAVGVEVIYISVYGRSRIGTAAVSASACLGIDERHRTARQASSAVVRRRQHGRVAGGIAKLKSQELLHL